jgi:aldehyde:ferredoxin oxidoreductase
MLGANCGVFDIDAIARSNYLCNELGIDTISAGATVGLVLQALDEGLIPERQLDLPETGGSRGELVHRLLQSIAERRGIGELLAQGVRHTAHELDLQERAAHVKGMGMPAYDPRVSEGMALAYMTSDRGACHLRTWPLGRELSGELPRFGVEQKVEFVVLQQNDKAAEECLGVCQFPYGIGLLSDDLPRLLDAALGESWDRDMLRLAGERIWNLSRMINVRRGVQRADDYLPERFSTDSLPSGPLAGRIISRDLQDVMLDQYYAMRGWTADGIPEESTLERLSLERILADPPELEVG